MTLNIRWQRLVMDGGTCDRCGLSEEEAEKAVGKLKDSLKPLGIDVKFEKEKLSKDEFEENPTDSNLILINGEPMEKWIGADTGESECCDTCGDEECRTVIVNGEEYEVVPSELIVEAGLKATSKIKSRECCDNP